MRIEYLLGNAGLDRRGLSEQRLPWLDAPAVGIAVIEISEGYRLPKHSSGGSHELVDVSVGVAEKAARLRLELMAHAHVNVYPGAIEHGAHAVPVLAGDGVQVPSSRDLDAGGQQEILAVG